DIGSAGAVPKPKVAVVKRKKAQEPKEPEVIPDPNEDYSGYIKAMRKVWRKKRAERVHSRKHAPRPDGTVSSMIRTQS
ncbi:hypothetical protein N4286_14945, partial [Staphylococcus aureus]|uniref:hypothetical protein n=1 Tax=Staphylococcus aureus TaxID=1280 RepID=UPI0021B0B493